MGRPEARARGHRQLQRGAGEGGAFLAAPTQGSEVGTATVPVLSTVLSGPRPPMLTGCNEAGSTGSPRGVKERLERWSLSLQPWTPFHPGSLCAALPPRCLDSTQGRRLQAAPHLLRSLPRTPLRGRRVILRPRTPADSRLDLDPYTSGVCRECGRVKE